ncbi:MAG TPA: ComF family protein [Burkholderiales bacterium]|jgi:ComF family protein|nr:ComF family protein [Burkholderiales bacterium]
MRNWPRLLFGGSCYLCRGAADDLLCAPCDADLPRLSGTRCPRCALDSPRGVLCGRCLGDAPHYDATVAALAYEFPADALVHALKFRGELALASFLGREIARRISAIEIDSVVPVPLSAARLRTRGYNHAAEIARHLLPGKLDLALCERSRDTPPQMDLPFAERRRNVRGAFRCTRALMGASIAVVDDVMTTGATLNELARTLKDAGAARVVNLVVARTFAPD